MEAQQRDSHTGVDQNIVYFSDLRDDWYKSADLMARLIDRASSGTPTEFIGFPRQWAPIFALFRVKSGKHSSPKHFIPIASDLADEALAEIISSADKERRLRQLAEVFAAADPVVADVLHKLDRRVGARKPDFDSLIPLTGWQSYGRSEVQHLALEVNNVPVSGRNRAVVLPCSRARPYERSKTHRRLWRELASVNIERGTVDVLVASSIGVVPESLWGHPVALHYDSGVPDIYRVLRLMRIFFDKHRYDVVVDCLDFQPYSDCLCVVAREGLIQRVEKGPKIRVRKLPRP